MQQSRRVTGRYNYLSADGRLLYWKERTEPGRDGRAKDFCFYHGDREKGRGGDPVLLHLPDVIAAKAVIITEGEKQADLLKSWGLVATTLDSGANSKLPSAMAEHLTGKRIAILRDNDKPGLAYAESIAKALQGKFESLRVVLLPGLPDKGDVCDWTGDKAQLLAIIKATPEWVAPPEEKQPERRKLARPTNANSDITASMIEAAKAYPVGNLVELHEGKICCLVHEEKTASMVLYKAKNRLHCFGCGVDMDAIGVAQLQHGIGFKDAVMMLQGGA